LKESKDFLQIFGIWKNFLDNLRRAGKREEGKTIAI
jgi:hypothetical protein